MKLKNKSIKELARIEAKSLEKLKTAIATVLFFGVIISAYAFASSADYQEEVARASEYCDGVSGGHWPAYDKNIVCDFEEKQ